MAYTAVPSKSTGDLWTAADHNTYIKDNFAASVPDIFTTKGDLAVATSSATATRLAVGTDDQVLVADSGEASGVKWADLGNIAYARYTLTTAQDIPNASGTIVNFDNEEYDSENAVTTGAAWKFTVPAGLGGYYLVTAMLTADNSAEWQLNEKLDANLYKNGDFVQYLATFRSGASVTVAASTCGSTILELDAAEYIDIRAYQDSDAALALDDGGYRTSITIAKLF
jgi:hypothetical protein